MKKNKIIICAVALLLVLVSLIPIAFLKNGTKEKYDVLYFGDSIVAGWGNLKPIPERLSENTGMKVYNAGFGGMTMARVFDEQYVSDRLNAFTMASISEAIYLNDFSLIAMSSGRGSEQVIEYWSDRAETLSYIDLKSVKYVIIEFGTNDYLSDALLDNKENPLDTSTFGGALRFSIQNIKDGMPDATIIIESPVFNAIFENSQYLNNNGNSISDYVETERKIASEMGVYFLDTNAVSEINKDNYTDYLYDGLHTNVNGDKLISDCVTEFIKTLE